MEDEVETPVEAAEPAPVPEPAPPPPAPGTPAAAIAELRAWEAKHCRNGAIARNTAVVNVITNAVSLMETAITTIKE